MLFPEASILRNEYLYQVEVVFENTEFIISPAPSVRPPSIVITRSKTSPN